MNERQAACELVRLAKAVMGFSGRSYAEPLKSVMTPDAYGKFEADAKREYASTMRKMKALADKVVALLNAKYPEKPFGWRIMQDHFYVGNMQVFTNGKVSQYKVSLSGRMSIAGYRRDAGFSFSASFPVDGGNTGVTIGKPEFSAYFEWSGEKKFGGFPSARVIAEWYESGFYKNDDLLEVLNPAGFEENATTLEQIVAFLRKQSTWFDYEIDGDRVNASTRDHGSVGDEEPGERDIEEARRLGRLLKQEFGNSVKVSLDTIDEWVELDITIPKKVRR